MLRLLQLTSPSLPIGAFAYSQGLEYAAHAGWVKDRASLSDWLCGILNNVLSGLDVPVLHFSYSAFELGDDVRAAYYARLLHAARETAELTLEDRQVGRALARCLLALGVERASVWVNHEYAALPTLFALGSVHWRIPLRTACLGYMMSWAQNQVSAACRLLPIGQLDGQRVLSELSERIPSAVERGLACQGEEEIGFTAPAQVLASSLHETQYSRLFRS